MATLADWRDLLQGKDVDSSHFRFLFGDGLTESDAHEILKEIPRASDIMEVISFRWSDELGEALSDLELVKLATADHELWKSLAPDEVSSITGVRMAASRDEVLAALHQVPHADFVTVVGDAADLMIPNDRIYSALSEAFYGISSELMLQASLNLTVSGTASPYRRLWNSGADYVVTENEVLVYRSSILRDETQDVEWEDPPPVPPVGHLPAGKISRKEIKTELGASEPDFSRLICAEMSEDDLKLVLSSVPQGKAVESGFIRLLRGDFPELSKAEISALVLQDLANKRQVPELWEDIGEILDSLDQREHHFVDWDEFVDLAAESVADHLLTVCPSIFARDHLVGTRSDWSRLRNLSESVSLDWNLHTALVAPAVESPLDFSPYLELWGRRCRYSVTEDIIAIGRYPTWD